jgi:hypothetical protein
MNSLTEVEMPTVPETGATLDDFCTAFVTANPYTDNRVNEPSADDVDVDAIHQHAFDRLTALALEARDARRGLGAMLWGEAGIGKSHVLSRLVRWADGDGRACAVYLHNLQAGPDHLPRSLLKLVVSVLTAGQTQLFQRTALYELTTALVREALGAQANRFYPWPDAELAYMRWVDRLSREKPSRATLVSHSAYRVLFRFFQSGYRASTKRRDDGIAALAVRWLSGEALDPDEAQALDLPPGRWRDEPNALADNQQIKQVLVALSQLALSRGQPCLLLFDQVDNLDDAQAAALGRFLEALIDSAPNLLVVTSGIQASLLHWRQARVIQDSAWDRLAQFEIPLQRILPAEAERIVTARLARFLTPYSHLDIIRERTRHDPLFPLGLRWRDRFFQDRIDVRPREVINAAGEGWRREQAEIRRLGVQGWLAGWGSEQTVVIDGAEVSAPTAEEIRSAIDRKVAEKIGEHKGRRLAAPSKLPPDEGHLAGLVANLLRQCLDHGELYGVREVKQVSAGHGPRPPHDLLVKRRLADGRETSLGLVFAVAAHGNESAAVLRHLVQATPLPDRQFLVTDERRQLPIGDKGEEYFETLKRRSHPSFQHIALAFAELAELDALAAVVGLAKSHDLEITLRRETARAVAADEVIESLHRQGRYRAAPLLRELLSAS